MTNEVIYPIDQTQSGTRFVGSLKFTYESDHVVAATLALTRSGGTVAFYLNPAPVLPQLYWPESFVETSFSGGNYLGLSQDGSVDLYMITTLASPETYRYYSPTLAPEPPVTSTAFATPEELSAYTKGQIKVDDPRVPLLLDGATKAIQNYAGWTIYPAQDLMLTLDGGTEELFLPSLKVNALTALTVNDIAQDVNTLEWSRITGNVRRKDRCDFPDSWGGIVVSFNSGYDEVPADLKQIVIQVSAMALSSPTGATREQAGQVAMSWATTAPGVAGGLTLLQRDYDMIAPYILPKEA